LREQKRLKASAEKAEKVRERKERLSMRAEGLKLTGKRKRQEEPVSAIKYNLRHM